MKTWIIENINKAIAMILAAGAAISEVIQQIVGYIGA